ncbi:MAG: hypothetical protein V2A69_04555 [Pseudomonadota bacterium]
MKGLLLVISILWICWGTVLIIYTEPTRKVLENLFLPGRVKWLAVFPLIFGSILVAGAFYYRDMFWLSLILGILAITKGVYLMIGPAAQIKTLREWWLIRTSDSTIRFFGLITFLLGSALLSYVL